LPGAQRARGRKLPHQKYFTTNEHKSAYDKRLMSEPKTAYRNKRLLFLSPTCFNISYSTAQHFGFKPDAPPLKNRGAHFTASAPVRQEPYSYVTGGQFLHAIRSVVCVSVHWEAR